MNWLSHIGKHASRLASLELFRYIGPGFFVTVGFIDPGNWVTNVAAGSQFGYKLLWVVTLSTIILIIVQHNAAHLGIVTGLCLSEAASKFFRPWLRFLMLGSAMLACVSTALAELLGAAIGLNMLTGLPLIAGAVLSAIFSAWMLFSKNYQRLEKWIMGFVSLIGLAFMFEIWLADVSWTQTLAGWVTPAFPVGALPVIMGVLGAVVMPHNIFLHSEVIQSRQWNAQGDDVIRKQLKYEFLDTLTGMGAGWAINSAMIIMAAAVFFKNGVVVTELPQVTLTLEPIFGKLSATVFALGLLFAGLSSSVTAAMAGGSVFAGIFIEPFDINDPHSRVGLTITLVGALAVIMLLSNPFLGILWSQIILSLQLPLTIIPLILLTSSKKVMGTYANRRFGATILWIVGLIVIFLNLALLKDILLG
ncbi:MAG: Mg2+/Co2+ transporter [Geobacteraceae bacterium GWC2_55_20]|nr:MAG: Mg2+/Co2+ transporter [Geobacteraceae bacterium GWC2_55_20]OGU21667.1 MAG: Mg2+/Co2+ transporter [Geobacteraceae bacterium GWF2_54_21]HBA71885.1 Mg2+/Co2+ transporter [Geobacter sp.]HCE68829.1 Mg2+/Co2+ transporter [Geobacter sp.]